MKTNQIAHREQETDPIESVRNELRNFVTDKLPGLTGYFENDVVSVIQGRCRDNEENNSGESRNDWETYHAAVAYGKLLDINRRPAGYQDYEVNIHRTLQLWGAIRNLEEADNDEFQFLARQLRTIA